MYKQIIKTATIINFRSSVFEKKKQSYHRVREAMTIILLVILSIATNDKKEGRRTYRLELYKKTVRERQIQISEIMIVTLQRISKSHGEN